MTEIELDEDPRRDALRCIQCEFRADDSPDGCHEASEHADATGHRVDRVTPLDREPLSGPRPDPLVVMWMRQYLRERPTLPVVNSIAVNPKATTIRAWVTAHGTGTLSSAGRSLRELSDAYEAARKALPRADIPAGQGPASLFVRRGKDGHRALLFQPDDGEPVLVMWETMPDPAMDALWDHLAATLPHVTTEDAP